MESNLFLMKIKRFDVKNKTFSKHLRTLRATNNWYFIMNTNATTFIKNKLQKLFFCYNAVLY